MGFGRASREMPRKRPVQPLGCDDRLPGRSQPVRRQKQLPLEAGFAMLTHRGVGWAHATSREGEPYKVSASARCAEMATAFGQPTTRA